jgi:hypothetical protein
MSNATGNRSFGARPVKVAGAFLALLLTLLAAAPAHAGSHSQTTVKPPKTDKRCMIIIRCIDRPDGPYCQHWCV